MRCVTLLHRPFSLRMVRIRSSPLHWAWWCFLFALILVRLLMDPNPEHKQTCCSSCCFQSLLSYLPTSRIISDWSYSSHPPWCFPSFIDQGFHLFSLRLSLAQILSFLGFKLGWHSFWLETCYRCLGGKLRRRRLAIDYCFSLEAQAHTFP